MKLKEFMTYDPLSVIEPLNKVADRAGFGSNLGFSRLSKTKTLHLILADKAAGLVARVRPLEESRPEDIKLNLEWVTAANKAGAPFLKPITTEVLTFAAGGLQFTATLWPLAESRPVSPKEMARVLRNTHDSPPPANLPDWLSVRFRRVRDWADQLPALPDLLPAGAVKESLSLVNIAVSKLERLSAKAPKVLLHGDAHPGNVVIFKKEPFGCDLDEICTGPAEVDLSMTFLQAERFPGPDPAAGQKLAKAYGRTYDRELLQAIVDAKSVSRLMSLVRFWDYPGIAEDFMQRLGAIKNGGKFTKFYGGEALSPFAKSNY